MRAKSIKALLNTIKICLLLEKTLLSLKTVLKPTQVNTYILRRRFEKITLKELGKLAL